MIIRHVAVERTRTTSCNGFPTGHVTYRDSLILSPPPVKVAMTVTLTCQRWARSRAVVTPDVSVGQV